MTSTPRSTGGETLCGRCRAEHDAWLDARMPPPVPQIAAHAAYDSTPAAITERYRARADRWHTAVRHAQRLIRDRCAREHR